MNRRVTTVLFGENLQKVEDDQESSSSGSGSSLSESGFYMAMSERGRSRTESPNARFKKQ